MSRRLPTFSRSQADRAQRERMRNASGCLADGLRRPRRRLGPPARGFQLLAGLGLAWVLCACNGEPVEPPASQFNAVAQAEAPDPGASGAESSASPGSIWVRVLDRNAVPIEGASVSVELGNGIVREAEEVELGKHRLEGLDAEIVPIAVVVGGRRHLLEHATQNRYATLVLPVGGELDVVWQVPQLAGLPDGELLLIVAARADPELRFEIPLDPGPSYTGRASIPYLLPGQYLASLELWRLPEEEEDAGEAQAVEAPVKILPLTQPRALWIAEGEASQIVLGSPTIAGGAQP